MENEVKDSDNVKQDMSIDVYGRKKVGSCMGSCIHAAEARVRAGGLPGMPGTGLALMWDVRFAARGASQRGRARHIAYRS